MKRYLMQYPGDPPMVVHEYTREEFLKEYPRKPIQLWLGGVLQSEIPLEPGEIICDLCGDDPGTIVFVNGSQGICRACFDRGVGPYCKPVMEG